MALLISLAVCAVVAAAEVVHQRRVRRAAFLAFGASATPAPWTRVAPTLRVLSVGLVVAGGVLLLSLEQQSAVKPRSARLSKQLLICLDVSPSMLVQDAGPDVPRQTRAQWAGRALAPLLNSADTARDTRITVVAFYTKAVPVLVDTHDKAVVSHLIDGLGLFRAFDPGNTDLAGGVNAALDLARPWAAGSATLVVVSDGDSDSGAAMLRPLPPSIAESLVIGIGDTTRAGEVGGRRSRQDAASLKAIAARLRGRYIDCTRTPVPPSAALDLAMRAAPGPPPGLIRVLALAAIGVGGVLAGVITPALLAWGGPRERTTRRQTGGSARSTESYGIKEIAA